MATPCNMKEVMIFCGGQYIFDDEEEDKEESKVVEIIGREDKREQEFIKGCSKYVKPYLKLSHLLRQKCVRELSM